MKRIFISHASKDKHIVQTFMDDILIGALGINYNDIFCTSTDGTKIRSGDDWRDAIKEHLEGAKVTFLIITPYYKESEVCLNEMGAAWVSDGVTLPLFVEPINYRSVGILQEVKQVEKLLDGSSLDRIKDELQRILEIPDGQIKSDRWSEKRDNFLKEVNEYIKSHPFQNPITKEQVEYLGNQVEHLKSENNSLKEKVNELANEKKKLEDLNTDLKSALTPEVVWKVETKHLNLKSMDEFESLCDQVKGEMSKLHGIVQCIIFLDYSHKEMYADTYKNDPAIRNAVARDLITTSEKPDWESTKIMRQLHVSLDKLKSFVDEKRKDDSFVFAYESKYESPLDLRNLGFWEEVLGLPNGYLF